MDNRPEEFGLQQDAGERNQGDQGRDQRQGAQQLLPIPDLVVMIDFKVQLKDFFEVLQLVGGCFRHIGLEGMQDAFVMHHA